MPRNGSGVYSKPANTTVAAGTKIESTKFNTLMDDIAADLNAARPVVAGGTGVASIAAFKTACNLVIGTDIQAYDTVLAAIAGLTSAADKLPYFSGSGTADVADFSSFGRSIVGDVNAAAARTTLELETIGQSEAEAGTGTTQRVFTAERVAQAIAALASTSGAPNVVLEDQKSAGTQGGTASSGAWRIRDLNTTVRNTGELVSLSGNQFSFNVSGWLEYTMPLLQVNRAQVRLYNVTDATYVMGRGGYTSTSGSEIPFSGGGAVVAGKTYRLEYAAETSRGAYGLGYAGNFEVTEVYTRLLFWSA